MVFGLYDEMWTARVDVVSCPSLELTLPARNDVVENEFSEKLRVAVERAIHETVRNDPERRGVPAAHHQRAAELGIPLPEPEPRLVPFCPVPTVDGQMWQSPSNLRNLAPVPDNALIVSCTNPLAQAVGEALEQDEDLAGRCFRENHKLQGYRWYDRIPQLGKAEFHMVRENGAQTIREETYDGKGVDEQVEKIELSMRGINKHAEDTTLRIRAPMAFGNPWTTEPDEIGLIVARGTAIRPEALTKLATDAYWSMGKGENNWLHADWQARVAWHARTLLDGMDDADHEAISEGFEQHLRDRMGAAKEVVIRYRNDGPLEVTIER